MGNLQSRFAPRETNLDDEHPQVPGTESNVDDGKPQVAEKVSSRPVEDIPATHPQTNVDDGKPQVAEEAFSAVVEGIPASHRQTNLNDEHLQVPGITEPVLRKISERLGSEWQKLATHLGLSAAEIERIMMDNPGQTENQIFNMLIKWRRKQSTSADQRDMLCTALMEIGRRDIVEDLKEITRLQRPYTFAYLQQQIIDNYKQTTTTIHAHPILETRNVTTRPQTTTYVLKGHKKNPVFKACSYTPHEDMGEALISYLKTNQYLWEMSEGPIISQLMCLVWKNQESLPERMTELFAKFAEVLFIRRNENDQHRMSTMMSIIDGLGRVALQGLLDSRGESFIFNESEFQDCQSCLDEGCRVGFVQRDTFTSGRVEKVFVFFPHKSIQEYFAACHLVKLLQDDVNSFHHHLKQIGEGNVLAMESLLRFCCGRSRQAAGLILDHIQEMQGDESKLQRLARLLLFESSSEELATKLVRPTWVVCKSNEDLKSLSYYLQHVTPPLQGTGFYMCVRKQKLTLLRGILLSDSMESAGLIYVVYNLSEQEEEELIFLEETLGVVDEQRRAQLTIVVCIEAKSCFDVRRVSHSFLRMQEQIGRLALFMHQRSPDEVVDLLKALQGCRLSVLQLYGTNLHARVRGVGHISSSLRVLQLIACRLVDDDMRVLISILPARHGLERLDLDDNAFSLDAVRVLTIRRLPRLLMLRLCNIGLDAELVGQVVSENLPHLKETEEGLFEA